jgi:lipid-A-disaccharide synthase
MSPLSWQILRHMNYLPYVGLPNILAGKFVVPELLQNNATPEKITEEVLKLVADKEAANTIRREFEQIHLTLRQNTEEKAAQAILGLVG